MAKIGISSLAQMLRRVGTSLRAGLDARSVFQREANYGSGVHRRMVSRVNESIASGNGLAESLSKTHGYFPPLVCTLVDVGERSGRLDEVLVGLADHYDHLLSLRRTFLLGILWPAIQFFAALGIVGLLIWVMGVIGNMGQGGGGMDVLGLGLTGTSGLLVYLLFVGSTLGGAAVLVMALVRGAFGSAPMRLAMRIPVIGNCLRTAALSRLAWTLGLTLDSGIDARRAMELALRSTENSYYTSRLDKVDAGLAEGREFHEALRRTGLFPDDFLQSLETAEISGTHGESLHRLANEYRQRAQSAAKALTVAASFLTWVLVAVMIIALIFRMAMMIFAPYYELLDGFK